MTVLPKNFILVDDDHLNNTISKMVLKKVFEEVIVRDFKDPELALTYIETGYGKGAYLEKTTLLLDINMPTLSGWEFLEKFRTYNDTIKNQFSIYMLSSSIDPVDIERAKLHPLVNGFIEKPLNKGSVSGMFG